MIEHAALHWHPLAFGLAGAAVCLIAGLFIAGIASATMRYLWITLRRRFRSRRGWDRLLRERLEELR